MNSNIELSGMYFKELYPAPEGVSDYCVDLDAADEDEIKANSSKDGLWDSFSPFEPTAKQKNKHYHAEPLEVLVDANKNTIDLWNADKAWACEILQNSVQHELALSLFTQYVKKWESYILNRRANRKSKSRTNQANVWLRKRIIDVKKAVSDFPVPLNNLKHDGNRKETAQAWASKCIDSIVASAANDMTLYQAVEVATLFAKEWGFVVKTPAQIFEPLEGESSEAFIARSEKEAAGFRMARLTDDKWWFRKIEIAYRQFCEHCQILNGRVRKGASIYLSEVGIRDYRARKIAGEIALSKLVARNDDTGEEYNMLEIHKSSISSPENRRHELMVRMRGFQNIATEQKLVSGFFTLTAPSKYHAYTVLNNQGKAKENKFYRGFTPKQTQKYLSSVWQKVRPALARLDVPLFGFRVAEPHHDGTPHWHAVFFFKPEHEQVIRYVLAEYFTQEDRDELKVNDEDLKTWRELVISKKGRKQSLNVVDNKTVDDALIVVRDRIKARVKYVGMDPAKGGAVGYIAKYIAKNIDGYKLDNEKTETPADKAAFATCGWASTWRIRQFQQIGGPPVSVWRELRRLPQDEQVKAKKAAAKAKGEKYKPQVYVVADLLESERPMEVARIAADSPNWSMYIQAMGGIFATRKTFPLRMVYKLTVNAYGENVKKLKGLGDNDKTMITHTDNWVIGKPSTESAFDLDLKKNASFSPWSSVSNCTSCCERYTEQEVTELWEDLSQRGEVLAPDDFKRLLLGGVISLDSANKSGKIRTRKVKVKQSYLNHSRYAIELWEDVVDKEFLYIEGIVNRAPDKNSRIDDIARLEKLKSERNGDLKLWYHDSGWRTSHRVRVDSGWNIDLHKELIRSGDHCAVKDEDGNYVKVSVNTEVRLANIKTWCNENGIELKTTTVVASIVDLAKELDPVTGQYEQAIKAWLLAGENYKNFVDRELNEHELWVDTGSLSPKSYRDVDSEDTSEMNEANCKHEDSIQSLGNKFDKGEVNISKFVPLLFEYFSVDHDDQSEYQEIKSKWGYLVDFKQTKAEVCDE